MGSSRRAGGRLLAFLGDVQSRGLAVALQSLNLGSLVGKPIYELFFGLADYVCPTDGSVDGGIPRDAFTEMVVEAVESGITTLDALTDAQVLTIFESFVTISVFDRVANDIASGAILLAKTPKEAARLQIEMRDFIAGAVHDAVARQATDFRTLNQEDARQVVTQIYEQAFSILKSLGERKVDE